MMLSSMRPLSCNHTWLPRRESTHRNPTFILLPTKRETCVCFGVYLLSCPLFPFFFFFWHYGFSFCDYSLFFHIVLLYLNSLSLLIILLIFLFLFFLYHPHLHRCSRRPCSLLLLSSPLICPNPLSLFLFISLSLSGSSQSSFLASVSYLSIFLFSSSCFVTHPLLSEGMHHTHIYI